MQDTAQATATTMSNKKGVSASLKDSKGRKRDESVPLQKRNQVITTMAFIQTSQEASKSSGPVCSIRANVTRRLLKKPCAQSSTLPIVNKQRLTGNSMHRNATASPLLSLPPEIRNRIFNLVLGCQRLWISYKPHEHFTRTIKGQRHHVHVPGGLYHQTGARFDKKLHLGLLRVCRQTYGEVALLPYALNTFFFKDVWVRRKFMKERRPVQQRAIGNYKYMSYDKMKEVRLSHGGPKLVGNASNRHRISTNPFLGPSTYQLTGSDKWRRSPLACSLPSYCCSTGPMYTALKPNYIELVNGNRSSIRIAPCETPRKPTYKEWVRDQVVTTRAVNE